MGRSAAADSLAVGDSIHVFPLGLSRCHHRTISLSWRLDSLSLDFGRHGQTLGTLGLDNYWNWGEPLANNSLLDIRLIECECDGIPPVLRKP